MIFPQDQELSRKHCMVFPLDGRYFLVDYKSSNGVRVNDKPVEHCFLATGDRVSMGEQVFTFEQLDEGAPASSSKAQHTMLDLQQNLAKETVVLLQEEATTSGPAESKEEGDAFKKLIILYQVSKLIASELKLEDLLNKVIDLAIQVSKADRGFVLLVGKDGKFTTVVSRKMEGMMTSDGPIHISGSIVRETCESKKPLLTQDAMMDQRFQTSGSVMMYNIRSAMCVPMFNRQGGLSGVIYLDNRLQSNKFTEEDLQLLSAFADQAAIALQNAILFQKAKDETQIRNNLSRYLSPQVVEKVLRDGHAPNVGGKVVRTSILFADIRGFTTFSEKQGAQKVIQFLNEFLPTMTKIIFANQGTLDKFLGDGIMAVFGAPFEIQLNAVKAIQAAVYMQHEMHNINRVRLQNGELPLHMGIGINTGEVISGNVGLASEEEGQSRLEFTVIGDTVNTAARLQGAAGPGEVLITEQTLIESRDTIEGRLRVVPRGEMTFKGKDVPVNIFKIEQLGGS
jgi:adenylate cyclase